MPATAGGSTSGSSSSVITTERPGNRRVARRYAAGVPTTSRITSASPFTSAEMRSASCTTFVPSWSQISRGGMRPKIDATGTNRNANTSSDASPRNALNASRPGRIAPAYFFFFAGFFFAACLTITAGFLTCRNPSALNVACADAEFRLAR